LSQIKSKAIVLSSIKYGDSSLILKCYTKENGLYTFFINRYKSKSSPIQPSHLLALTILDLDYTYTQGKMGKIKECKCEQISQKLHTDLTLISISQFIAEVLIRSIHEDEHPDNNLYYFIIDYLERIEKAEIITADIPFRFLLELSKIIGIYPEVNALKEIGLNEIAEVIEVASTAPLVKLNSPSKNKAFEFMLQHYKNLVPNFGELRTISILREVLN